jgi:tetratricopeptide (TPR) repeat protein
MGRFDEAITYAKQGQKIDPTSPNSNVGLAYSLNLAGRYDEAIQATQKALELDPGFGLAHAFLVESYLGKGMYGEAISKMEKMEDTHPLTISSLGYAYAMSGRVADARKMLKQLDQLSLSRHVPAISRAKIYIGLNEKDRAFKWLDQALNERAWEFGTLKVGYIFEPLRKDPRFKDLMRRAGLPQ